MELIKPSVWPSVIVSLVYAFRVKLTSLLDRVKEAEGTGGFKVALADRSTN